ncbi:MAG: right-handed parallel beta-helix repeat-containing protein [Kiritimatiellae bacterium]|nr:right-handed parallel beta-helix repeat-containing protein [Kiritimatiellia bacterium]
MRGCRILWMGAVVACAVSVQGKSLFVNPAASSGGNGTSAAPYRTIAEAQSALRTLRQSGSLVSGERVEIVLAAGTYALTDTWKFSKQDNGNENAPVVWRSADKGSARIIGGILIPPNRFRSVSDEEILQRIPEEARTHVVVADLTDLSPGKIPELPDSYGGAPNPPLLYVNHSLMEFARWPNEGWTSFTNATDHGIDKETKKKYPGAFLYDNPRIRRWHPESGVWLNGFWTHDWDNRSLRVATINTSSNEIRLAGVSPYGIAGGTWGRKDRRFYAFNLLDELDVPGEWYVDRVRKLLYLYPPNGKLSDSDEIVLTLADRPLVQFESESSHIFLQNLVFEYSFGTMLTLTNVKHIEISGCMIANGAQGGISLNGMRCAIRNCDIGGLGTYGISVTGGDRKKLIRADNVLENNRIHDYAKFQKTYAAGIHVNGVGQVIRHNKICNAPHCAVLYGGNEHLFEYNDVHHVLLETGDAGAYYTGRDWTTQGTVLRYNFTHELGSGAVGAGNTMGFYFDDCDCGDEVYGNIFWKVSRGIMIGGGREHPIRNNIFAECQIGMSIDARGMTWKQWNNPSDPSWCLDQKARALNYQEEPWKSRYPRLANIWNDSPREPLYNPVETNLFLDCQKDVLVLDENTRQLQDKLTIDGNLAVNTTGDSSLAKPDPRVKGVGLVSGTAEQPLGLGFRDAAHGDFRIESGAALFRLMPGFRKIPVEEFGIQKNRK